MEEFGLEPNRNQHPEQEVRWQRQQQFEFESIE
jgi:hypothetical protein